MYTDFAPILIFIFFALLLIGALFVLQNIISPKQNKSGDKLSTYECGEVPEGSAWVKFNIRFYVIALIFIIFDVEILFMFPWAVVFKQVGLLALIEMLIFLLILIVGFAYVWVKDDLSWVKMTVRYGRGRYAPLQKKGNES